MKKSFVLFVILFFVSFSFINCSEDEVTNPSSDANNPTVNITSPPDGESFPEGTNISFKGSGEDHEGVDLHEDSLVWKSDHDDTIGTGKSFDNDTLSLGTHVVTLTGTDSEGRTCSESITIEVTIPEGFVLIPAGTFTMGSPMDEPGRDTYETQHQVTLTNGFYMSKYEVTESLWYEVMGGTPTNSQFPKDTVSWDMAVEFCNALSVKEGYTPAYTINGSNGDVTWNRDANGYRLPTEAEWEYACRATTTTAFNNNTNCLSSDTEANYSGTYPLYGCLAGVSRGIPTEVGTFPPNGWGLYDIHGNLFEWVWDCYRSDYENLASEDPVYEVGQGASRVFRGGSWSYYAVECRSAFRRGEGPIEAYVDSGFRVCLGAGAR